MVDHNELAECIAMIDDMNRDEPELWVEIDWDDIALYFLDNAYPSDACQDG